uniref:Uncharacterized protein n=1 Tax=Ovis aries TaxID=9940 RepID=A0AC11CME2_SHEEP
MVRASTVGAHLPASGLDIFGDLRKMNKRQLYYQVLNFAMIVSSALMIWKGLIVLTGSESPIVVVLSGSMEPAFHRGDLLFLTNFREDPIRAGEIVVFKVEGRDIPIVHRVIKVHEKDNGDIKFLTKGDNNEVDDRGLYKEGQNWLEKKDVVGRARGFLPYVGMVTIIMNDYPKFKSPETQWEACAGMGVRWLCLLGVWSLGRRCVRVCVAMCLHLPCAGGSLGDRAQGGGLPLVLSWPSADQPGSEHARRPRLPAACAHDSPLRFLTVCSFGCDGCVCATETRILK